MTPFLFGLERGNWQYQVSGSGYAWARSGEERTRGVADVSALMAYTYLLSAKLALIPALELTLPTHGEVGSDHVSEDVRLSIVFHASKTWSGSLAGLLPLAEQTAPSVSRYKQAIAAKAIYSWNDETSAFVLLSRYYSRGRGGSSVFGAEIDFPLARKLTGSISASQGLTAAKRDRIVELDLTYVF